jgi:hypothetical protein
VAEVLYYATPAFVLLLVMELLSFKYLRDDDLVGYEARDTRTSLTMGGGNVVINAVSSSSTRPRTTACTTAPTRSTSIATTAAS